MEKETTFWSEQPIYRGERVNRAYLSEQRPTQSRSFIEASSKFEKSVELLMSPSDNSEEINKFIHEFHQVEGGMKLSNNIINLLSHFLDREEYEKLCLWGYSDITMRSRIRQKLIGYSAVTILPVHIKVKNKIYKLTCGYLTHLTIHSNFRTLGLAPYLISYSLDQAYQRDTKVACFLSPFQINKSHPLNYWIRPVHLENCRVGGLPLYRLNKKEVYIKENKTEVRIQDVRDLSSVQLNRLSAFYKIKTRNYDLCLNLDGNNLLKYAHVYPSREVSYQTHIYGLYSYIITEMCTQTQTSLKCMTLLWIVGDIDIVLKFCLDQARAESVDTLNIFELGDIREKSLQKINAYKTSAVNYINTYNMSIQPTPHKTIFPFV